MPLDYKRLERVVNGQDGLNIGIAAPYNPNYNSPTGLDQKVPERLSFLEDYGDFLRFKGGNDLSLLTAPEYFLGNKEWDGMRWAPSPVSSSANNSHLSNISSRNPDVIFNPPVFSSSPFRRGDRASNQSKINNFRNLGLGNYFISSNYPELGQYYRNPSTDYSTLITGQDGSFPPRKVMNQSPFYWRGEKIGKTTKQSYLNEITPNMFNRWEATYVPGQSSSIKPYEAPWDSGVGLSSNLLSNNFYNQICMDNDCFPEIPGDKKAFLLNAADVNYKRSSYRPPLEVYADESSLNKYDDESRLFFTDRLKDNTMVVPWGEKESISGFWPVLQNQQPVPLDHHYYDSSKRQFFNPNTVPQGSQFPYHTFTTQQPTYLR
ncbi:MAG TPA: hypothetical protein VHA52_10085 [Candidatus Babeliaceae bacterium]|nr:hypothetical protein [Candidatus Babeliaceae bacterium]